MEHKLSRSVYTLLQLQSGLFSSLPSITERIRSIRGQVEGRGGVL